LAGDGRRMAVWAEPLDETGGTGLRVQTRRQRLREHGRTGGGTSWYTQGAGAGVRAAFWAEDGG